MAEAGWYQDPQDPGFVQFFDGRQWTGARRPLPAPAPIGTNAAQPTQHVGMPPWQAPATPPAPPAPRRSRTRLIVAIVGVLAVAAGSAAWLLWPGGDSRALTFDGKPIAEPAALLAGAEQDVAALVGTRHGAKNASTRCYFAQPRNTPTGRSASDIEQTMWCGPVLFVDGQPAQDYLVIPLMRTGSSGGAVVLRTAPGIDSIQPQALDGTLHYVRPDGLTPARSAGLTVPDPPAADQDVLTTAPLGPTPTPPGLPDARMVGRTAGVTLLAAGQVSRYGEGDTARSAPSGEKLYAFAVKYGPGDIGRAPATAEFVVGNGTPRPLPVATGDEWIIAAVPNGSSANVVLDNAGYEQSLSIPDGRPGPGNIDVLVRSHRTGVVATTTRIPVRLTNGSGSADVTWQANATTANLDFWIPGHVFRHPTNAHDAVLSVHLNYHYSDQPGTTYGFDPQLLRLRLPDGTLLKATNVAGKNKINDVFVVPADFTGGTLEIGGQEQVGGVTVAVERTVPIPVSIPAG